MLLNRYATLILVLALLIGGCANNATKIKVIPDGTFIERFVDGFDYYVHENYPSEDELDSALQRLNGFRNRIAQDWNFSTDEQVNYYAFANRTDLGYFTGQETNGRAIMGDKVIHSIYLADAHELAHVITMYPILKQTDTTQVHVSNFWLEGIAMYYTWPSVYFADRTEEIGYWNGLPIHYHAKQLLQENTLPPIDSLVYGNRVFNGYPAGTTYPMAGSFVTFLLGEGHTDTDAIASYRKLLTAANTSRSKKDVETAFLKAFGISIDQAEQAWYAFLLQWNGS